LPLHLVKLINLIQYFVVKLAEEVLIMNVFHVLLKIIEHLIIIMNALVLINITMMGPILSVYNAIIHGISFHKFYINLV